MQQDLKTSWGVNMESILTKPPRGPAGGPSMLIIYTSLHWEQDTKLCNNKKRQPDEQRERERERERGKSEKELEKEKKKDVGSILVDIKLSNHSGSKL